MSAPTNPMPSFDRPAVHRPAVTLAMPLARALDLSAYRLAGGTALAWALGHRRSDDLDFFTRIPSHVDGTEQQRIVAALTTMDPHATIRAVAHATVHATVHGCRISFFGVDGNWLSAPTAVAEGLNLATIDEIAAMKLVAVASRSTKKDFFDLHSLCSRGMDARYMFSLMQQMYGPKRVDLGAGQHLVRALVDFSDAEGEEDPMVYDGTRWTTARDSAVRLSAELKAYLPHLASAQQSPPAPGRRR